MVGWWGLFGEKARWRGRWVVFERGVPGILGNRVVLINPHASEGLQKGPLIRRGSQCIGTELVDVGLDATDVGVEDVNSHLLLRQR